MTQQYIPTKCLILGVLVISMILVPIVTPADDQSTNGIQAESSGYGIKYVKQHVVLSRDMVRISYPQDKEAAIVTKDGNENNSTLRTRSILLAQPRRFDREGIYIWRDSEGIWKIKTISDTELTVTGRIESDKTISLQPINIITVPRIVLEKSIPNLDNVAIIAAKEIPVDKATPIQFKAEGAYVDFDLQINGKSDLSRIYLGSRGLNPAISPFRLGNRPVESPVPSTSVRIEDKNVSTPKSSPSTVKTSPNNKPQSSSRGGSGGGSGRHTSRRSNSQ
jgi:hypothetical protein